MIKTTVAITYFSYLLLGGYSMVGGLDQAEHVSVVSAKSNMCRLISDTPGC